ncbi:MAG: hypothetical protein ACI8RD_005532, partial [Bacillariaceae sp.]|jgi:hypothetical protein
VLVLCYYFIIVKNGDISKLVREVQQLDTNNDFMLCSPWISDFNSDFNIHTLDYFLSIIFYYGDYFFLKMGQWISTASLPVVIEDGNFPLCHNI